ncbi:MAG: hypothetical protein NC833_04950, partial [Candidatus Omnitrophica bacterium]|nr:hypothetical protein [Candidatus Omnitrophota bacterium]
EYCMEVGKTHFRIYMKRCPSVGIMNKRKVEKYLYYCEHCDILYKRIIEKYGFNYKIRFINKDKGVCVVSVKKEKD